MAIACLPLAGRYEIVRPLNSGGMGAVYEARDLRLNDSPCAIKQLLHSRGKGEYLNAKFEAEMAVLSSLDHPGIPKIRDFFTEAGRRYLVMDLIPGPNLYQVLEAGGPLEARSLVEEMLQVLDILGYLHERGLLHRDVKPANLIRDSRNGRLKLVDFGLARSFEIDGTFMTQTLVGTSGYAPPEQLAGRAEPASDLYAVGATMLHLLTAVSPLFAYPSLDKALDPTLLAVLRKAVAMHPGERYPNAAAFAAALKGWLNTPVRSAPDRRVLAGAGATLTAAMLLGLVFHRPAPAPAPVLSAVAPVVAQVQVQPPPVQPPVLPPPVDAPLADPAVVAPAPLVASTPLATVQETVQEVAAQVRRTLAGRLPLPLYPLAARRDRPVAVVEPQVPQPTPQVELGTLDLTALGPTGPVLSNGGPLFLRQHGVRLHIPFGFQARQENGEIIATPGPTLPATPHREVRAKVYPSADSAVALVANFKSRTRTTGDIVSEEELPDGYRVTLNNNGVTYFYRILVKDRGKVRYVCETQGQLESQARDLVAQLQPFFGRTSLEGRTPLLAAAPVTALSYQRYSLDAQIQGSSPTNTAPATPPPAATTAPATTPTAPAAGLPTASSTSSGPPATTTQPTVPLGVAPTGAGAAGGGGTVASQVSLPTTPPVSGNAGAPITGGGGGGGGYGGPPAAAR